MKKKELLHIDMGKGKIGIGTFKAPLQISKKVWKLVADKKEYWEFDMKKELHKNGGEKKKKMKKSISKIEAILDGYRFDSIHWYKKYPTGEIMVSEEVADILNIGNGILEALKELQKTGGDVRNK